ncbi:MAG: MerR family transcriptional regulator [Gammaproteobacteria bacterium]|nr:MAG: MerR family transcriptional regulator [Gammaproteobacteria bacterium]RLA11118.1 MAG: MerR family transcriptional regulator [Gammaproteobacteria bacterium]
MTDQSYKTRTVVTGYIVEEEVEFSLGDLSQACRVNAEWLMTLVGEGIIEPLDSNARWRFGGHCARRVRTVQRLQQDLGVNLAGAALALDLLAEMADLKSRLSVLEPGDQV